MLHWTEPLKIIITAHSVGLHANITIVGWNSLVLEQHIFLTDSIIEVSKILNRQSRSKLEIFDDMNKSVNAV